MQKISCEECGEIYEDHGDLSPCETCDKPSVMVENEEALRVFYLCRHQLIVSFDGVVGIDLKAVKVAMDLLDIENQYACADKVICYTEAIYAKKEGQ